MTSIHEDEASGLFVNPRLGVVETVVQNQKRPRVNVGVSTAGCLVRVALGLDGRLALDDILDNLGAVLVMNELGWHPGLEKLVGGLFRDDDSSHGKMLLVLEEHVTHQERLACVLLADNHHHRTFA